jgi:hypothetical protein
MPCSRYVVHAGTRQGAKPGSRSEASPRVLYGGIAPKANIERAKPRPRKREKFEPFEERLLESKNESTNRGSTRSLQNTSNERINQ